MGQAAFAPVDASVSQQPRFKPMLMLACLRDLQQELGSPQSVTVLARTSGLPVATTSRLLGQAEALGLVVQHDDGYYGLPGGNVPVAHRNHRYTLDQALSCRPFALLSAMHRLDSTHGRRAHSHGAITVASSLSPPSVSRILDAAHEYGLVERVDYGRWELVPPALHDAGLPAGGDLAAPSRLLRELQRRTGLVALLFAPGLLAGSRTRILLSLATAPGAFGISTALPSDVAALRHAPLGADPAGLAISAFLDPGADLPLALERVRRRSLAWGRSPFPGLGLMAAPVWRGSAVAGSVALLVPEETLLVPAARGRLSKVLGEAAAGLSRQTTADSGLPSPAVSPTENPVEDWEWIARGTRTAGRSSGAPQQSGAHQALMELGQETKAAALLFAPLLVPSPIRVCIDRTRGPRGHVINTAPRGSAHTALWRSPLSADAAGLAILAHQERPAVPHDPRALAEIRERGYASGRSAFADHDLVAAPVWRRGVPAGAVAVLVPTDRLRLRAHRDALVDAVQRCAKGLPDGALGGTDPSRLFRPRP